MRFAVEVRHHSWYTPGSVTPSLVALLRQHNTCWTSIEYPGVPNRILNTSNFLYIRWIGQHGSFTQHDRERLDRKENMQAWLEEISKFDSKVEALFGYFNNDYAGFAVGSAQRFKQLAGLASVDFAQPVQGQLF